VRVPCSYRYCIAFAAGVSIEDVNVVAFNKPDSSGTPNIELETTITFSQQDDGTFVNEATAQNLAKMLVNNASSVLNTSMYMQKFEVIAAVNITLNIQNPVSPSEAHASSPSVNKGDESSMFGPVREHHALVIDLRYTEECVHMWPLGCLLSIFSYVLIRKCIISPDKVS
jgi:hypothetical protein